LIPALNLFHRSRLRRPAGAAGLLSGGLIAALVAAAEAPGAAPAPPVEAVRPTAGPIRALPPYVQVEEIAESTWVLRAGTANVVAALTAEGWVLVDTGTRAEAIALRAETQRLAVRPILAVFNTHFHDDHAGGNAVYRGMGVPVYAGAGTRQAQRTIRARMEAGVPLEAARLDSAAAQASPGPERERLVAFYEFLARWWREGLAEARRDSQFVVPADRTFERRLALRIGGLAIDARTTGRGHTLDDVVVAFPGRRVVAAGDLAVRGGAPWADQFTGEGSMDGLLAAQDSLAAWIAGDFGAAAAGAGEWRVVPGHGAVMNPAEVAADGDSLRRLRACARRAFEAGRSGPVAGRDCAGAGFPGESAAYAAWLFDHEWRTREPGGPRARLTKP
jgi:glyoxylase-like metal-dependent hydrolase (beta-lactamase superfamily II)